MIHAKFIGEDGSMGFRNGSIYSLRTEIKKDSFLGRKAWLCIEDVRHGFVCPYSSLEAFLENWKIVDINK